MHHASHAQLSIACCPSYSPLLPLIDWPRAVLCFIVPLSALLQPTASYSISPLAVRYYQPTASYSSSPLAVCCRVMSCGQVWSNRWVVLHKTDGLLYYSSNTDREPRGAIAVQAIAQSLSADHHDCNLCAVLRGVIQTVSFHWRMRCVCRIWRVWTRFPVPSDLSGSRFGCS